ncbi:MAG: threonine--tRNA ligase [Planctomycetes bacterium]|nr:threonine--tRNA ligase [Planctomycetota bacterium]
MNCPHHIHIYKAVPRSYRDLPVRLAEFGTVYRYEQSGELAGLLRVRGFTQDDAHIFCTPEQLPQEIAGTVQLSLEILQVLQLSDCRIRLGLRDPDSDKYSGDPELWTLAEQQLRDVVRGLELDCSEEIGEAAFYGPKIDFIVRDCIGREWQLGTVQVDYTLPERFDLTYVGADNKPHRPIMIHRAPFGSIERLMAVLIEHYAGEFPLWLAPVQVGLVTVSEKSADYAGQVHARLLEAGLRAELDLSSEKIGPKKHRMRARKIPYILVVGEQEAADGSVNVNPRDGQTPGSVSLDTFVRACQDEIAAKASSEPGRGSSR